MKIQFKITNMTCASCATVNKNSLLKAKGVLRAKVDFPSGQATVDYDEKIIDEQKIKEAITKNGYGVI